MLDLDALIEEAAVVAEIEAGTPNHWLAQNANPRVVAVLGAARTREVVNVAEWTAEEEQYILDNMRWMTDAEIAEKLGRSANAVEIHRYRHLQYDQRRKDPDWPTLQQVMVIMGVKCQKTVAMWVNEGLIEARVLATPAGEIRAISRTMLFRWAVNPENWIYFKHERVIDPHLRRLLELRRQRWGDEWWTPGQVGAYHGVTHMAINNRINEGTLPAKRWGNWWIKRSDAVKLQIVPRKGFTPAVAWTSAGDAFLIIARGLGYSYAAIARLCGWDDGRVVFRLNTLVEQGMVPDLIVSHDLAVQFNPSTGELFADWRDFARRFPRLQGAIERFLGGKSSQRDLLFVGYTLAAWAAWFAKGEQQKTLAPKIRHGKQTVRTLQRQWVELQSWGVEPLL